MDENYTGFAAFYDEFMDDIPYDDWSEYIVGLLKERGIDEGLVCELGCGTCEITKRLQAAGYDMIGIDKSEDMLALAYDKFFDEGINGIMLLNQDMRSFELYGTVNAFVCVCDSLNYITDKNDLLKVFKLVNNYLEKDGLFIFDLKTTCFFEEDYGNREFTDESEGAILRWENRYDSKTRLNEYNLTITYATEEGDDVINECHVQRAYTLEEIKELLGSAGLKFIKAVDYDTKKEPDAGTKRLYVIASEGYQEGKTYIGG